jgi:MraZ protein
MSTNASEPIVYHSCFKHGVDDKRRLQIPAKWRMDGQENRFTLILWRRGPQQEACLLALPVPLMKVLMEKIQAMPFSDPKAEALRRVLGANSDQVVMDKFGRIGLSESMAAAAGIEKEAVLVGMFDRFQVWSPQRYATAASADEAVLADAMALL